MPELARFDYVGPIDIEPREETKHTSMAFCQLVTNENAEAGGEVTEEVLRSTSWLRLSSNSSIDVTSFRTAMGTGTFLSRPDYISAQGADIEAIDEITQQARFRLAAQAISNFPAVRERFTRPAD